MATEKPKAARKSTTDPHPLFSGNPAQYTDDVEHRVDPDQDGVPQEKTPAAMAQQGRWSRA